MISTKGRYALRTMVDIAAHSQNGSLVPLKEIADRQGISEKYLERVVALLVKAKELIGIRGIDGGYRLTKPVKDYTALEIIIAAEKTIAPVACLADKAYPCPRRKVCPTLAMWEEYYAMITAFFAGKSLQDLVDDYQAKAKV